MKLATITLAVAFALATTFAMAEGTLNYSTPAARPVARSPEVSRSHALWQSGLGTFPEIPWPRSYRNPTGSTLTPSATSRGG
jgi:hypothetical protein